MKSFIKYMNLRESGYGFNSHKAEAIVFKILGELHGSQDEKRQHAIELLNSPEGKEKVAELLGSHTPELLDKVVGTIIAELED